MRRRRRSRGTWFPAFGQSAGTENESNDVAGREITLNLTPGGGVVTEIQDLTYDYPHEPTDGSADHSLQDIIGNEYLLQRIVGKCFGMYQREADNDDSYACLLGVGFFVARAGDEGVSPIGTSTMSPAEINNNYSPLTVNCIREPWIWRRTWILQDAPSSNAAINGSQPAWPRSTQGYHSVADGPHIDSKVKRRIGQDDRLYAAVSACPWQVADYGSESSFGNVFVWLDYRIFGQIRKAKQKSAF